MYWMEVVELIGFYPIHLFTHSFKEDDMKRLMEIAVPIFLPLLMLWGIFLLLPSNTHAASLSESFSFDAPLTIEFWHPHGDDRGELM